MTLKSVSFRTSLLATTTDVLGTVGIHCARTAKFIVNTASSLAAYTEEGQALSPEVYLCDSAEELIKRAGTGTYIVLGSSEGVEEAGPAALKYGAPLCVSRWNIFVERSANGPCRFGVFSETGDPAALTADETLLSSYDPNFPIVMLAQNGTNRVRLIPAGQPAVEFRFNADTDIAELPDRGHITEITAMIASAEGVGGGAFPEYVGRILSVAIGRSHGTLIAVINSDDIDLPAILTDAVSFTPPIDLFKMYRAHLEEGKTSESVNALQSASELIAGFIASDGITVFDTSGRVRGYRAFVRPPAGDDRPAMGGARTRAFSSLRDAVGQGVLTGAFFRSQDGRTDVVRGNDV